MLIKYFGAGASSSGAVEYVEKNESAKILKGNTETTRELIKSNTNKLKYRSGVLSFGSDRPSKEQVQEIIALFEESTFAGLRQDQYNILWVEHTDTDNYHIHFIIPRLELTTMKSFNPHYHKQDQKRLLLLQKYINFKYDFINPFEAHRRQTLEIKQDWENRNKAKETINEVVTNAISQGLINNRDELIDFLIDNGLEVKTSKHYIAIKGDEDKKFIRLKGAYYDESYRSREELTQELEREERENRATTFTEHREDRAELDRLIRYKAERVNSTYKEKYNNSNMAIVSLTDSQPMATGLYSDVQQGNQLEQERVSLDFKKSDKPREQSDIYLYTEQQDTNQQRQHNNIYKIGELDNDTIGATTTRSTNPSQDEEQQLIENSRAVRERIQEQYINYNRRIQEHNSKTAREFQSDIKATAERTYQSIERYSKQQQKEQSNSIRRIREVTEQASRVRESRYSNKRTIEDITKKYKLEIKNRNMRQRQKR